MRWISDAGERQVDDGAARSPSGDAQCRETGLGREAFAWYLCVVAIFKNEAHYLEEWLAFCLLEGVEHVLLYDHSSTDACHEVLQPWIEAGFVELFDWPVPWKDKAQDKAYLDALSRLRGRARWAAFIDIDEFLFSPTGGKLPSVLARYEGRAGVVVNWQCYGTSRHKTRPSGLTIENYTRRARSTWARNRRGKTIVDPLQAKEPWSPHLFKVEPGQQLVTEDFKPVRMVRDSKWRKALRHIAAWLPYLPLDPYSIRTASPKQVSVSELRINHYVTRSGDEFLLKYKDRNRMLDRDRLSHWRYHDRNEVDDPILAAKAGAVRDVVAKIHDGVFERVTNRRPIRPAA
jgi:hypothetical protein